jgi:AcrR family transcriptional regulator
MRPNAKRGRPRTFDREKALRDALDIFWDKGFEGAQLTELTKVMGINPPSFYAAFGSKESLFREAVGLYVQMADDRIRPVLEGSLTAETGIRGLLEQSADIAVSSPGSRGCMIVLGIVNCLPGTTALRDLLLEKREESLVRIRSRLQRGVAESDLPSGTNVERLVRFYAATLQGISLQARDGATRVELQDIIDAAMTVLIAPERYP